MGAGAVAVAVAAVHGAASERSYPWALSEGKSEVDTTRCVP